jgi:predicted lipoprotein with Yx(FWY)xxD motif
MTRFLGTARTYSAKATVATIAATAGFAAAALVGVALARTFTLNVATNATVTNQLSTTKTENVVVNAHGFAVYMLTGDSESHPKCTEANGCFRFWPPLKVSSPIRLGKAPSIRGRLGVWQRNGFFQVTLAGHPLYRYAGDSQRHAATGEGVVSFGGTWHVEKPGAASGSATTMMTTTTTMTCLYPPC